MHIIINKCAAEMITNGQEHYLGTLICNFILQQKSIDCFFSVYAPVGLGILVSGSHEKVNLIRVGWADPPFGK